MCLTDLNTSRMAKYPGRRQLFEPNLLSHPKIPPHLKLRKTLERLHIMLDRRRPPKLNLQDQAQVFNLALCQPRMLHPLLHRTLIHITDTRQLLLRQRAIECSPLCFRHKAVKGCHPVLA